MGDGGGGGGRKGRGKSGGGGSTNGDAGQPGEVVRAANKANNLGASRDEIVSNLRSGKITVAQVEAAHDAMFKASFKETNEKKLDQIQEKLSAMRSAVNLHERGAPKPRPSRVPGGAR